MDGLGDAAGSIESRNVTGHGGSASRSRASRAMTWLRHGKLFELAFQVKHVFAQLDKTGVHFGEVVVSWRRLAKACAQLLQFGSGGVEFEPTPGRLEIVQPSSRLPLMQQAADLPLPR